MPQSIALLLYLGFATSAVSVTLTRAAVTHGLREWVGRRVPSLAGLFHCPYCTSHWVAGVLTLIYRPVVEPVFISIDLAVSLAAIVGIAGVVTGIMLSTIPALSEKKEPKS